MHHHIILSSQCQNNCKFCATGMLDHTLVSEDVIEFLDIKNGDTVLLTGGEPTLYKDFIKVARYIKEQGGYVEILTNSIRFSDKKFCTEASEFIDSAQCSFYSWSEAITTYLTENSTAYKHTISGIHNLIDSSVDVQIKTLVNLRPCFHTLNMTVSKIIDEFELNSVWLSGCDFEGNLQINHGLIVPLRLCQPYIDKAINIATSSGVTVELMYLPLCIMSARNALLVSSRRGGCDIDSYLSGKDIEESKCYDYTYGYECLNCRYQNRCTGVWSKYLNLYNGGKI